MALIRKKGRKETILITGGGGRIARRMAQLMLKNGYDVKALVKRRDQLVNLPAGCIPYVGDIKDARALEGACEGVDIVMHLAAIVSEWKADTNEILDTNVQGTRNMLDAAVAAGVSHFIFPSTVDVYGRKRSGVLTEDSALRPSDRYGHSKMLAEHVIEEYKDRIDYTIFRQAAAYGPGFETSFYKIFRLIKEQKLYIVGNGENNLSMIHIDDLTDAYLLAIKDRISKGKIYNLSDGKQYTPLYLFNLVADMLNVERPTRHISPILVRVIAKAHNVDSDELRFLTSDRIIDIGKIRRELGFVPKVDIKEAGYDIVKKFLTARGNVVLNK